MADEFGRQIVPGQFEEVIRFVSVTSTKLKKLICIYKFYWTGNIFSFGMKKHIEYCKNLALYVRRK